MSQNDILNILKSEPDKWFDSNFLTEKLKINRSSCVTRLKQLRKYGFVDYKFVKKCKGKYFYKNKKVLI